LNLRTPSVEILRDLSDSRWAVFDVLPTFFSHDDPWVVMAAFEAYIRRAYRLYSLLSVDYQEGDVEDDGDTPHVVVWRFKLASSRFSPETPRISALP
jgi:acetyl-CoA carboxylase / biotin carboxylase 1